MADKVEILVNGEWVELKQIEHFEFTSPLMPGMLLGEQIEQVEKGVYFIPDSLLREKGIEEVWSFATAVVDQFNRSNPGTILAVERDVVKSGTRVVVIFGGDA